MYRFSMATVTHTSPSVDTICQCSMYVLSLAMFVTCVKFYLYMALIVSEPDVTVLRLPYYNI